VFFYDALGAQFEAVDYATTGSGSPAVRSVLYYQNTWGAKPLAKMTETESVTLTLRLLDTAAEFDTATGGYNRRANIFPLVRVITKDGIHEVPEDELAKLY
jgi:proteasome beta subunit